MQPNELTLEAQMFDAKINSMDKTCLLAPLFFLMPVMFPPMRSACAA